MLGGPAPPGHAPHLGGEGVSLLGRGPWGSRCCPRRQCVQVPLQQWFPGSAPLLRWGPRSRGDSPPHRHGLGGQWKRFEPCSALEAPGAAPNSPSRISWRVSEPPNPLDTQMLPPTPHCSQYQCRSAPRPPHGHSCAVPMPQQGSHSARSRCLCSACHLARWALSQGRSGFCPHGAGHVHNPAPSRPQHCPAGPSCHRILSPSAQHATPQAGQHTGWAHQPDELGRGLQWKAPGQERSP